MAESVREADKEVRGVRDLVLEGSFDQVRIYFVDSTSCIQTKKFYSLYTRT